MPIPTITDAQLRDAIGDVITQYAPKSLVFPWWALGAKRDQWPGRLRSDADQGNDGQPRVHAYVIMRTEASGEWKSANCARNNFEYEIWAFQYYETGNATANSDITFNAELDALRFRFNDLSLVEADLPTQAELLSRRIAPLSWRIDVDKFGDELLHFATGTLVIEAV